MTDFPHPDSPTMATVSPASTAKETPSTARLMYRRRDDFDILHFHIDHLHYPLMRPFADRILTTLHGRLDLPDLPAFYRAFPELPLVSISNAQRTPMPPVNWTPKDLLPFCERPTEDYVAFLGRISPEKGPEQAIEIATKAGVTLKMAAKVDAADQSYWDHIVAPMIAAHPNVEFIGEINEHQKADFLGNARALLFPINWPEPFGLAMIEAMASGTPVIASGHGSVPEVIENNVTGCITHSVTEAADALGRLKLLDRQKIRQQFETRFTAARTTQDYLDIYRRLLRLLIAAHTSN